MFRHDHRPALAVTVGWRRHVVTLTGSGDIDISTAGLLSGG